MKENTQLACNPQLEDILLTNQIGCNWWKITPETNTKEAAKDQKKIQTKKKLSGQIKKTKTNKLLNYYKYINSGRTN